MEVTWEELQTGKNCTGWMLAKPIILKKQTKILHQIPNNH